jgi:transcriptional regulator with XRE-family HTH domain
MIQLPPPLWPSTLTTLRSWRIAHQLTQVRLARKAGVTQAEISQLERGGRVPTLRTVAKLGAALGVEPGALLQPAMPLSLSREATDRIARSILHGRPLSTPMENRLARAIGSLAIQKLRAFRAPGYRRYRRTRWVALHRPVWIQCLYGAGVATQVLRRLNTLLMSQGVHEKRGS